MHRQLHYSKHIRHICILLDFISSSVRMPVERVNLPSLSIFPGFWGQKLLMKGVPACCKPSSFFDQSVQFCLQHKEGKKIANLRPFSVIHLQLLIILFMQFSFVLPVPLIWSAAINRINQTIDPKRAKLGNAF